ncbi:MGDG synthase family glycosyltransferase [Gracilibacillus alcaliphilus]|uniref:MGDG synthase family glycosyltransferase n=1 Tax=Gracilibacillus alcaliphilus TaxID=1401441 RepID=UPI00195EBC81|nr:glycosyltransferase [Gracilibacillus alcaliphilus]MBM7676040.1 UDP-N-acetylglucosamine:LPS N-acetylglucosamine transferase [Gracilibacillus alcaliphilus]
MKDNQKALFLPFMQIPTGHHHVADALMEAFQKMNHTIPCQKVDILSYSYGRIECLVSSTYLFWIKQIPQSYNWLYDQLAYKQVSKRNRQLLYEAIFTYFFKRLIRETEPAILFCTHSLPSHLASRLKRNRKLAAVTVNVYTDYFVNRVWGIDGIDYHIVPTVQVKAFLMSHGVKEGHIFVTGIPVHEAFVQTASLPEDKRNITVLVSGGSLGVGEIYQILSNRSSHKNLHYYVLCGKNEKLYQQLVSRSDPHVTPIPYLTSKQEMNQLYDKVDAVLTKPGGVTISECLKKNKAVFIYHALPGQEKINLEQLQELGVVIPINTDHGSIEDQIIRYFSDEVWQKQYQKNITDYHKNLEKKSLTEILKVMMS